MATHTDIRSALATLVTGLTVGGYVLRVSDVSDALDMVATEQGGHVVAVLVQDAPGDQWDGTRSYVAVLSAAAGRGISGDVYTNAEIPDGMAIGARRAEGFGELRRV